MGFAFAAPWLVAALAVLPVLWWLLRVIPPSPRTISFPAIRLLQGLAAAEETPARTPPWLLLMRLVLAALLILGLAHPLVNPSPAFSGVGPIVLVVDDGWAAAADWSAREAKMEDLVNRAEREGRQVALLTTAPTDLTVEPLQLMPASDAKAAIHALKPKPWPTDREAAAKRLQTASTLHAADVFWLTDGLDDPTMGVAFGRALRTAGPTTIIQPEESRLALLIGAGPDGTDLAVTVRRAAATKPGMIHLRALDRDGRMLGQADGAFAEGAFSTDVSFNLPLELRNRVERIDIDGEPSAASTLLLDESARRRLVGIASSQESGAAQPLLSETYYLERGLKPFSDIRQNSVSALVASGVSMIVLPDGDAGGDQAKVDLTKWVEAGGVLLRFAGPALADSTDDSLLPVALRRGDRTIGGSLSWETPAHLAAFAADSPLAGLSVPDDVTVTRQVLAEPAVDLASKSWARLSDGTPIVTGQRRGRGFIVLIHTTANTAWSNFALSGLFVDVLRRVEQLSRGDGAVGEGTLKPFRVADGFGRLEQPTASAHAVEAKSFASTHVEQSHSPGLYGDEDAFRALNVSSNFVMPSPLGPVPGGIALAGYEATQEQDLRPLILGLALALLLIDIVIGYGLRGLLLVRGLAAIGLIVLLGGSAYADQKSSSESDAQIIAATKTLRLAFVKTGDSDVDRISHDGLVGLGNVLSQRTSVETGDPTSVDIEQDDLVFYPLIYWPLTSSQPALSAAAADRVNKFLATGGTILFDTADQDGASGMDADATAARLKTLLGGVHFPPLVQMPTDHVLTKSFYLIQDTPGRWASGPLWVEPADDRVNDGVSTIVIGSNDWAAAWAVDGQGAPLYPVVPGGESQREMAYRFGVNLVMYALTGNYKADQVHVSAILERLGQ